MNVFVIEPIRYWVSVVGVGAVDLAAATGPQHVAAAHDRGDERRRPVLRLFGGDSAEQGELGGLEHGRILTEESS